MRPSHQKSLPIPGLESYSEHFLGVWPYSSAEMEEAYSTALIDPVYKDTMHAHGSEGVKQLVLRTILL